MGLTPEALCPQYFHLWPYRLWLFGCVKAVNCLFLLPCALAVWNHKNGTLNYTIPASSAGRGVFYFITNSSGAWFALVGPSVLDWGVAPSYAVAYTVSRETVLRRFAVRCVEALRRNVLWARRVQGYAIM